MHTGWLLAGYICSMIGSGAIIYHEMTQMDRRIGIVDALVRIGLVFMPIANTIFSAFFGSILIGYKLSGVTVRNPFYRDQ